MVDVLPFKAISDMKKLRRETYTLYVYIYNIIHILNEAESQLQLLWPITVRVNKTASSKSASG